MSKITLPLAELKPALTGLAKIIAKRCTLPVLNHVKVERTQEGWIALTATDLDSFITCRMEQPSTGDPITLLVPYDEFLKITKNCEKNDSILVGTDGETVTIEYAVGNQVAEAKVTSLPVVEFPSIPKIKGDSIPLHDALRLAIHDALECSSTDPTRQILNGACIDVSKPRAHYVVGTDGRHLFSSNSFNLALKETLVIPSHKFVGWKEFNNDGEWQLKVAAAEKKDDPAYLQISSRRWRFITKQIEGNYPNWRQVVPDSKSAKTALTLDPQNLQALISIIERMPCHDAVNFTVGLEWKDKQLHLLGKDQHGSEWMKVPVEVNGMGPDINIYLNRNLLTKAFGFGLNTIELIDAMSPLRFSQEGRQMIVMPLRPDVGNPAPAAPKPEPEKPEPTPKAKPTQGAEPMPENKPEATPAKAETPTERTNMPANNGNGSHKEATEKPTLESALNQIESIKGKYREAIKGLNDLSDTLKLIHKEQRTTEKEVQSVRTTLEKLQSVKL